MNNVIIPWKKDEQTKYSNGDHQKIFEEKPAHGLNAYCEYVLWECSTEFMVTNGLPTDADVLQWINWMQARPDAASVEIQDALRTCNEYIKPAPERA